MEKRPDQLTASSRGARQRRPLGSLRARIACRDSVAGSGTPEAANSPPDLAACVSNPPIGIGRRMGMQPQSLFPQMGPTPRSPGSLLTESPCVELSGCIPHNGGNWAVVWVSRTYSTAVRERSDPHLPCRQGRSVSCAGLFSVRAVPTVGTFVLLMNVSTACERIHAVKEELPGRPRYVYRGSRSLPFFFC